MSQRRNWPAIIKKLNSSSSGKMRIKMGSPGSAQVTRCRLLEQWAGVERGHDQADTHGVIVEHRRARYRPIRNERDPRQRPLPDVLVLVVGGGGGSIEVLLQL